MSIILKLVSLEQFANILFIISSFYVIASGSEAVQSELERQRQGERTSVSTSSALSSAENALISTWYVVIGYLIYILAAIGRKNQLERDIQAGTTNTSTGPITLIIIGFVISLIGTVIRIPALKQRVSEERTVVL